MKRIIKYRIIWEDGANPNYVGPKAIDIETPHFLNIRIEFERNDLFGKRRIECDYYDMETKETGTHILYREYDTSPAGQIKYRSFNAEGEEIHKCESNLGYLRDKCLDALDDCVYKSHDGFDHFAVDPMPAIFVENFVKKKNKYRLLYENDRTIDFVRISDLIEFIKNESFGIKISRLLPNNHKVQILIYEEIGDEKNSSYCALPCLEDQKFVYSSDLNKIRRYVLNGNPQECRDVVAIQKREVGSMERDLDKEK